MTWPTTSVGFGTAGGETVTGVVTLGAETGAGGDAGPTELADAGGAGTGAGADSPLDPIGTVGDFKRPTDRASVA